MLNSAPGALCRSALAFCALAASGALVLFGLAFGRRKASEKAAEDERRALEDITRELRRRNAQLTSLYNVFSEITQTLTLRYVVETTLRETQKIMEADMVVLRRREGDDLVVIGAMADGGLKIQGLAPVPVHDEGPTGEAARTRRAVRLEQDAELIMGNRPNRSTPESPSSQTGKPPFESGVITPLIVGTRLVGTMSCWSRKPSHFTTDDERLLEMMASSVATAIVASETVDTSERRAYIDPLTELPNRHQLNEDLDSTLAMLSEGGRKAVVAMADVDHFKHFNDNYGHKMGDITLQTVAAKLREVIRAGDFIYRYGGEEFLAIFTDTERDEAEELAERLRETIEKVQLFDADGRPLAPVTISIGLASMPGDASSIGALIEMADAAMYESKRNGRNQTTTWKTRLSA